ncbi:MAG: SpoIIE family protein phosphatase [Flavobacteriales bacterium]|nr:SpoIIE family protein phosphatase [Flavobacteriales bacterium]
MKTVRLLPFLVLLVMACEKTVDENSNSIEQEGIIIPQTQKLDTVNGYAFNTVKGDSISPLINSLGDTILSGHFFQIHGKKIPKDSVVKPHVINVSDFEKLETVPINNNGFVPDDNAFTTSVNSADLIVTSCETDTSIAPLINSLGDTVLTGIPYHSSGDKKAFIQKPSVPASPPSVKDNAREDIRFLGLDHGLSSVSIRGMCKDQNENIWLGLNGGGISRYDGVSFTNYTISEGLTSNIIFDIITDKEGNLWISTWEGGICKYDGTELTVYNESHGLPTNNIWSSYCDSKGNLWFATFQGGLVKYDGQSFTNYSMREGLPNHFVYTVSEDLDGNIWLGTHFGAVKFDGESFTTINASHGLTGPIYGLTCDQKGNIWMASYASGVFVYDGEKLTNYNTENGLNSNKVDNVNVDAEGKIWIGTYGSGITIFDGHRFQYLSEEDGLTSNYCLDVLFDSGNNAWLGSWGGGVNIITQNSFSHSYNQSPRELPFDDVYAITQDSRGNIWYGTNNNGIAIQKGNSFYKLGYEESLSGKLVYDFYEDVDSSMWMTVSGGGIFHYQNEQFLQYSIPQGLSGGFPYNIKRYKNNLWIGTWNNGLNEFDGESFTHYTNKEGMSSDNIYQTLPDKSGGFWIATWGGGISYMKDDQIIHYTEKEGLSSNTVFTVFEDDNSNIWIGTFGGGACKFDGKSFSYFTTDNGLPTNNVWSIIQDNDGHIWMGTDNGLVRLTEMQNNEFKIASFSKADGLKGMDFFANSVSLGKDNTLRWGTGKAVESIDLNTFKLSKQSPQPHLKEITVNEEEVDFHNVDQKELAFTYQEAAPFYNYPLQATFPYEKNHLKFSFAAIDWNAPHKIKYSYRLKGLNENWSVPSNVTTADYRNIPYGTYTFELMAIGESGEWSDAFEYDFTILPPWWHSWWARILFGIAAFLIILTLIKWRTQKLKNRQRELESEIAAATQDLRVKNQQIEQQKEAVEQAHQKTELQKTIIEETHKEITDSILYAKHLQDAILPKQEEVDKHFKENFILFKPKDVVSGDFYWFEQINDISFLAVADCTGHGVPGAVISIVCSNALNRAVKEFNIVEPAKILDKVRELVIETFTKSGSEIKDGMDISLCAFKDGKIYHSGANNPLWIIRKTDLLSEEQKADRGTILEDEFSLIEIKANKQPVGLYEKMQGFFQTEITPQKGDILYLFTDGFADQFGGDKGKKLKYKPFKRLLLRTFNAGLKDQGTQINSEFENWKGNLEQIDDVCVIGLRV